MCAWLEALFQIHTAKVDEQRYGLMLVPRGCFKTTVGTFATCIKLLVDNPNARILLSSHKHEAAKEMLSAIKADLQHPKFKEIFGDWKVGASRWTEEAITIGERSVAYREPSIDTCGVDAPKTGAHYDYIIIDDVHNEINSSSETGRKRAFRHIITCYPLLEPNGVMGLWGTHWDARDAYAKILEVEAEREQRGDPTTWVKLIRKPWLEDGNLYFPARLGEKFLQKMREEIPDKWFANWYLNQPMEEGSVFFPGAGLWVRDMKYTSTDFLYPTVHVIDANLGELNTGVYQKPVYVVLLHDPAVSEKDSADYNALLVVAYDADLKWYILEAKRCVGPDKTLEWIEAFVRTYNIQKYSYEPIGSQRLWRRLVKERIEKANLPMPIIHEYSGRTSRGRRDKRSRIELIQPKMKAGEIVIGRGLTDLLHEFENYPQLSHEDLLDALAQGFEAQKRPDPYQTTPALESDDKRLRDVLDGRGGKSLQPNAGIATPVLRSYNG